MVVEVEVDEEIRLKKVWCAADAGLVIAPDGARNQIEGGIIQGASFVMREQVRFEDGQVATATWDDYPILRFSDVPEIEIELIDNPNEPTLGLGEASVGPTGAAIGNALARALGKRIRDLPLTREQDHGYAAGRMTKAIREVAMTSLRATRSEPHCCLPRCWPRWRAGAQELQAGKPIRLIVGLSAGGGTDVTARLIAQKMSQNMGTTVLVENKAGGNFIPAGRKS